MSDEDEWDVDEIPAVVLKESWEDEDIEEEEAIPSPQKSIPKPEKKQIQPVKQKKKLAQIIAKKEEVVETELEKKQRLAKSVRDSDLENAKTLFGGMAVADNASDYELFANDLCATFLKIQNSPNYYIFAETLVRNLIVPMNLDDTRKVSSVISASINEKQKSLKDKKKKKKGGATPTVAKGIDMTNYGISKLKIGETYEEDDYDDFM
jgi:translation initiation factor 3 subunit J